MCTALDYVARSTAVGRLAEAECRRPPSRVQSRGAQQAEATSRLLARSIDIDNAENTGTPIVKQQTWFGKVCRRRIWVSLINSIKSSNTPDTEFWNRNDKQNKLFMKLSRSPELFSKPFNAFKSECIVNRKHRGIKNTQNSNSLTWPSSVVSCTDYSCTEEIPLSGAQRNLKRSSELRATSQVISFGINVLSSVRVLPFSQITTVK
uniref:Uncharacterized protein n=1 Tax=Vespula pensylvanica TaxID=30213 RepID=A0A834PFB6_VESPE|nr:hypothetical protein H0235_001169 [Vespula pensylvanica]